MSYFVKIKTVFTEERSIESLSQLYTDKEELKAILKDLMGDFLVRPENLEGKKILLKPNWVRHSLEPQDEICLRTHNTFLLAALELFLERKPASVVIGDAPIQGCEWDKMHDQDFYAEIEKQSKRHNIEIKIVDFRRVTYDTRTHAVSSTNKPLDDYLIFDLGKESFLEPITKEEGTQFRVTSYDPDRMSEAHAPGSHKYCITKEVFSADVVISLPKIKTHQKTGMTGALKNFVGVNGDKDFLPHHRLGGTGHGGDCYPGNSYLRLWAEKAMDKANKNLGKKIFWFWQRLSMVLWILSRPKKVHQLAAGWHGNDTSWRMVLDLNKVVTYGKADGSLSPTPQRMVYSLCDGIIGGQGNGPLDPIPLPLGVVCFSNHPGITDVCMTQIMDFEINKLKLILKAQELSAKDDVFISLNREKADLSDLKKISINTLPAPGWEDYLKNN